MNISLDDGRTNSFTEPALRRLEEVTAKAANSIANQAKKVAESRGTNGREIEVTATDVKSGYDNWLRLGSQRGSLMLKIGNILVTLIMMSVPILYTKSSSSGSAEAEAFWFLAFLGFAVVGIVGLTVITISVRN